MYKLLKTKFIGVLVASVFILLPSIAIAESVRLEFEISPMIEGSRPWDGTGFSSAQIESEGEGFLGIGKSLLGQAGLDQFNQRIAPPDPVLCVILPHRDKMRCDLAPPGKDTLRYTVNIPAEMVNTTWFGVVLLDSDRANVVGGQDDLIGFGVVMVDESTLAAIRAGDPAARDLAKQAETQVTDIVSRFFGTNRSLFGKAGGGRVEVAKLAPSKCQYGCSMGDSMITISVGSDGW